MSWRTGRDEVTCAVRDLGSMPATGCEPVRRFSWRRAQRHRSGLQFLVSTGRHHGFESLEEARLLLALDFAGDLVDVLGQPVRLRYFTREGPREHVPDFLAFTRGGRWLIDVRPAARVAAEDRVAFAAAAEVAAAVGWRYAVVTGWKPHVLTTVDTLSSQRRPVSGGDVLVDLAPGAALVLDGAEWVVERAEPQYGRAVLVSTGGQRLPVTFRFLVNHPGCRPSSRTSAARAADGGRQPASLSDLTTRQREWVSLRVAHLLEAETGFRGGDPLRPGPGEPRPGFDPVATTRTQRRQEKAA